MNMRQNMAHKVHIHGFKVAVATAIIGVPSLFMFIAVHVTTTAVQSCAVILWRVTRRVASMAVVGVASVIRDGGSVIVGVLLTPGTWVLKVTPGKPLAVKAMVTSSPTIAPT